MVIHVGKTKVGSVPDRGDFRMFANDLVHQGIGAVDAFLGSGNESDGSRVRDDGDFIG